MSDSTSQIGWRNGHRGVVGMEVSRLVPDVAHNQLQPSGMDVGDDAAADGAKTDDPNGRTRYDLFCEQERSLLAAQEI